MEEMGASQIVVYSLEIHFQATEGQI